MQDERWQELVEMAKKNFKNVELATEDLTRETAEETIHSGTKDILKFQTPQGDFELVRENRPVVLEKKEHYSHRPGDTARTEYKLSETEFSHKLRVYKENLNGELEEITLDSLGL